MESTPTLFSNDFQINTDFIYLFIDKLCLGNHIIAITDVLQHIFEFLTLIL